MRLPWFFLLFILLFTGSLARADERSEILKLLAGSGTIDRINLDGPWALAFWSDRDAGGVSLLHKLDGSWVKVMGGGGVLVCKDLFLMGVPRSSLAALLNRESYRVSESEVEEAVRQGPGWAEDLRGRDLQTRDLELRSDWELTLMRNEIFAVHGREFRDPELRQYFRQRAWYRPDPAYRDSSPDCSRTSQRQVYC